MDERYRISEIRDGNTAVFAQIYDAYVDEIYRYVSRRIQGTSDIEDVVSTVFVKAWRGIKKCCRDANANIRARLYTIARHATVDHIRHAVSSESPMADLYDPADDDASPAERAQLHVMADRVMSYLRELGDDIHELFVLRYRQSLTYAEIAAINGKSIDANKQAYSRACTKVRTMFGASP